MRGIPEQGDAAGLKRPERRAQGQDVVPQDGR
jgi:hypothetical protein